MPKEAPGVYICTCDSNLCGGMIPVPWAAFRPLLIFDQISLLESLLQFTSKPFADVSPLQFVSKVSWGGYQQGQAHPG